MVERAQTVFSIVVHDALKTRNLGRWSGGLRLPAFVLAPLWASVMEKILTALIVEHQMIVPKMRARHMPMEVSLS